jgi:CheY-like chemotaxis protein
MDGATLIRKSREDPKLAETAFLMLSPAPSSAEAEQIGVLGITHCLAKPVKQSVLLDTLLLTLGLKPADVAAAAAPTPPQPTRSLRVLLAEDNAVNQVVAIGLLEKRGHTVMVAKNGREAVAIFEEAGVGGVDLVLMDVRMPKMDGFEATAAIRQLELVRGGHVPILAMTASAMKGDRERCLAAGMDGYLTKPVRAERLYEVIEESAASAEATATTSRPPPPARLFDLTPLRDRVDDSEEVMKGLIQTLLDELPVLMDRIARAVSARDAAELERVSRQLKDEVDIFSAEAVCQAVSRLEEKGRTAEFADVDAAWAEARQQVALLETALGELTQTNSGVFLKLDS